MYSSENLKRLTPGDASKRYFMKSFSAKLEMLLGGNVTEDTKRAQSPGRRV